ncbi:MAG: hypothetical protein JWM10_4773, partial [Myxococcaceae bacterium]|nr:hypothetical protein [Myxococcaceae bacterium]
TVQMTIPPSVVASRPPPAPAPGTSSSLKVLLVAVTVVGVLAFALGVLAGR